MRILFLLIAFIISVVSARANELLNIENVAFTSFATFSVPPTNPTFVLPTGDTLKFLASSTDGGSDSNDGLAATTGGGHGPWLTPNHAMNCGDVIIAEAGTHNQSFSTWGAVSNCPSTTGGIDGAGGIFEAVLLCVSPLGSCNINCATAACNSSGTGPSAGMNVTASNWAVEGWNINGNGPNALAFIADACSGTAATAFHHIAFVNDISINSAVGFGAEGCGTSVGGVDEFAVAGSLAQNSAQIAICDAAFVDVSPHNFDNEAGTHVFFGGNYAIASLNNPPCTQSDGEGFMMDTWDFVGFTGQGDIENNIVYHSSWAGIQVFMQNFVSSSLTLNIHHNTLFGDMVCPDFEPGSTGEINIQLNSNFPWTINTFDNISRTNEATQPFGTSPACSGTSTDHPYAMTMFPQAAGAGQPTLNTGGTGLQNVFFGTAPVCDNSPNCDSTKSILWFNTGAPSTNTFEDPLFANTSDLLANHIGAPTCTTNDVASCMGWNNGSQTATALTPIGDLIPTASGTAGKGFQPPGPCAANALYPTWLKGIVYLQWNGTTITENAGLVTKPCGF
jgi:hypothetical protein